MKLIVISAPSGTGKTTLCQKLLADFPELILSVSTTTRLPRKEEKHEREYFFISQAEFKKMISEEKFAEWAKVHGNYYGTSRKTIKDAFLKGKSVLLAIDVQGAASLRKAFPKECVTIFIAPPSMEELEVRLRSRGTDSEKTIQHRLRNAHAEMARRDAYDFIVINNDLEQAYKELRNTVDTQLHQKNLKPGKNG